jgi:hypothetical protein
MKKPEHLHGGDRLSQSFSPLEENTFQPSLIVAEEQDDIRMPRSATDIHKENLADLHVLPNGSLLVSLLFL